MKRDSKIRLLFYRERVGYEGDPFYSETYTDFSPPVPSKGDLVSIAAQAFEVVEVCYWYRRKQVDVGVSLKQAFIFPKSEEVDPELEEDLAIEDSVTEEVEEDLIDEAQAAHAYFSELHKEYRKQKEDSDDSNDADS